MRKSRKFCTGILSDSKFKTNRMTEKVIQVNGNDQEIGPISKVEAHLMSNIHKNIFHRAFSLFCVDKHNNLLIQKRSEHKHTFPLTWSNTVCSHPLFNTKERSQANFDGVRRAAKRRLFEELGIRIINLEAFKRVDSYLYKCPYDDLFGEAECSITSRSYHCCQNELYKFKKLQSLGSQSGKTHQSK